MAKNCPNCGKVVRDNALVCTNCMYQFPQAQNQPNQPSNDRTMVMPQGNRQGYPQGRQNRGNEADRTRIMQPHNQRDYQRGQQNNQSAYDNTVPFQQPVQQQGYPGGGGGNNGYYPGPGGNMQPNNNNKMMLYVIIGILAILIVVGLIVWLVTRSNEPERIYVQAPGTEVVGQTGDMTTAAPATDTAQVAAEAATEVAVVEEKPKEEKPQIVNGKMYLKGKVDGKYGVAMYIDLNSGTGKYCYTKYGAKKSMRLSVSSTGPVNNPSYITMSEYNPDGEYCGEWNGTYSNGKYSGTGQYHGTYMPFSLKLVNKSQTPY